MKKSKHFFFYKYDAYAMQMEIFENKQTLNENLCYGLHPKANTFWKKKTKHKSS